MRRRLWILSLRDRIQPLLLYYFSISYKSHGGEGRARGVGRVERADKGESDGAFVRQVQVVEGRRQSNRAVSGGLAVYFEDGEKYGVSTIVLYFVAR